MSLLRKKNPYPKPRSVKAMAKRAASKSLKKRK